MDCCAKATRNSKTTTPKDKVERILIRIFIREASLHFFPGNPSHIRRHIRRL